MKNTDQFLNDDEGDETIIAPRFDDEETVLARPVVPLEEVGDAPAARSASTPSAAPAPPYSRLRVAPRRSLVAVLVLVSALVGSALGVGGLYLYQQRRGTDANAAQQQAEAPAAQPTVQPATESRQQEASAPAQSSTPAPVAPEPDAQASEVSDSSKEAEREEPGGDAAAERRNDDDDDSARATKRGKKGARDEEPQRGAQRAPRYDEDTRPVVRDNDDDDTREARRVGVITYRPRRVRSPRRGPYYDSPDRLRRIFEGQP